MFSLLSKVLWIAIPLLLSASALFALLPHGAGMGRDSVEYLATGIHLASGKGFMTLDGTPYRYWPPLYPMILALISFLPFDPFISGGWISAMLLGVSCYLMGQVFRRVFLYNPSLALVGMVLFGISQSIFLLSIHILSDLLFITFVLAFFLLLSSKRGAWSVFWIGVVAGAAWLTRYIGVLLLLIGIGFFALDQTEHFRKRIKNIGLFFSSSSIPMLIWLIRNWMVFGDPFGAPPPASHTWEQNLEAMIRQIHTWIIPFGFSIEWGWFTVSILGTGAVVILLTGIKQKPTAPVWIIWCLLVSWGLLYPIFLWISSMQARITLPDARLMAPLYPSFLAFILAGLEGIRLLLKPYRLLAWLLPLGIALIWSIPSVQGWTQAIQQTRAQGAPLFNYLNVPEFRQSSVTMYLQSPGIPKGLPLYSNYCTAVYLYSREICSPSVWKRNPLYGDEYPLEQYLPEFPKGGTGILIWYEAGVFTHYYRPEDISRLYDMQPLFHGKDGGVYLFHRR